MTLESNITDNGPKVTFEIVKDKNGIVKVKMNGENITDLLSDKNLYFSKDGGAKLMLEFHIPEIK